MSIDRRPVEEPESVRRQVNPGVDCSWVLAEVWPFLDGESAAETCVELFRHLEACGNCQQEYALGARLKKLIATRCGGDRAPQWLKWLA